MLRFRIVDEHHGKYKIAERHFWGAELQQPTKTNQMVPIFVVFNIARRNKTQLTPTKACIINHAIRSSIFILVATAGRADNDRVNLMLVSIENFSAEVSTLVVCRLFRDIILVETDE